MIAAAIALALVLGAWGAEALSAQITPEAEARALIGLEYKGTFIGERFTDDSSCTDGGGGSPVSNGKVTHEWAFGEAWCQGRVVIFLQRRIGREEKQPIWRIVDAVLLPPFQRGSTQRIHDQVAMYLVGDCRLDGSIDDFFVALARFGDRKRVDWRTGVKHAWAFDLEHARIVSVSMKRVVCERPTPP
jgi:hypothetical protein